MHLGILTTIAAEPLVISQTCESFRKWGGSAINNCISDSKDYEMCFASFFARVCLCIIAPRALSFNLNKVAKKKSLQFLWVLVFA